MCRKWTARAIQEYHEHKDSKNSKDSSTKSSSNEKAELKQASSLLKYGRGGLLPNNVPYGPSVYYTGCGRR